MERTMKTTDEEIRFLKNLPKRKEKKWSFLETIGVAQKEVPIANLLGYYFTPTEKHGLGDLFIKALLETEYYELHDKKPFELSDEIKQLRCRDFKTAKVILEDITDNNKRIDLVIITDELVIAIEFKINHFLNNPLDEYVAKIKEHAGNRQMHFVILTPMWKKVEGSAANNKEFKQLILSKFIKKAENLRAENDEKYRWTDVPQEHFYKDFINMIENRANMNEMMKEYFDFFDEKPGEYPSIENSYKNLNDIKKAIESKVEDLRKSLNKDLNRELNCFQIIPNNKLDCAIVKQIGNVQIKIRLSLKGWQIEKWEKKGGVFIREKVVYIGKGNNDLDKAKVEDEILKINAIPLCNEELVVSGL